MLNDGETLMVMPNTPQIRLFPLLCVTVIDMTELSLRELSSMEKVLALPSGFHPEALPTASSFRVTNFINDEEFFDKVTEPLENFAAPTVSLLIIAIVIPLRVNVGDFVGPSIIKFDLSLVVIVTVLLVA